MHLELCAAHLFLLLLRSDVACLVFLDLVAVFAVAAATVVTRWHHLAPPP